MSTTAQAAARKEKTQRLITRMGVSALDAERALCENNWDEMSAADYLRRKVRMGG